MTGDERGMVVGKKKATGMSKRLGFTDRQTINENKDILRFNERLEREAKGLPPESPRGPRGRRPEGPDGSARPEGRGAPADARGRPARPSREARPPRPPALDDEQLTALRTAYAAVVGESGLEAAAETVLSQLAGHASFERATMVGWEQAAGGHAADRTAEQWELLRSAWLAIRLALLEAYVALNPDAQALLDQERKQQARQAKASRTRRRPSRGPSERRERRPSTPAVPAGPRPPSPAALARMAAAAAATAAESGAVTPSIDHEQEREATIDPVTDLVDEAPTHPVVASGGEGTSAEVSADDARVGTDQDTPTETEVGERADEAHTEDEGVATDIGAEHAGYAAPIPPADTDENQLSFGFDQR